MDGHQVFLRRAVRHTLSVRRRAVSKAWLMGPLLGVVLVMASLVALSSVRGVWATPAPPKDGGSTIPIPPPVPPTPVLSTSDSTSASTPDDIGTGFQLGILGLGLATTVLTLDGRRVEVSGGPAFVKVDAMGRQSVELPIALPIGAELGEFQDPSSGIEWRPGPKGKMDGALIFALAGEEASFVLFLEEVHGTGQSMEGIISRVELVMGPVSRGLGWFIDGEVGFTAELSRLPRAVSISLQEIDRASSELLASLEEEASVSQTLVAEVAYAVSLEVLLTDTQAETLIRTVSINMMVAETWVGNWPEGAVRIARIGGNGQAQFLDTISIETAVPGRAAFLAVSPDGFSTFALVALEAAHEEALDSSSNWPLWLGVALALFIVTLSGGVIILRFGIKMT